MRIAIVGAGLSGLTAAYTLHRDYGTADVTLYEASPRLGGIVETQHCNGFTLECGADSWVTEKPWAEELAFELGIGSQILRSNDRNRRTYIARGDALIPLPTGMRMMVPTDIATIRSSALFSAALAAYEQEPQRADELRAASLASRGADADESVAAFVRRHFGDEVTRDVAAPLLAGVFGGDVERLSARALLAPFVALEAAHGSLILGLQRSQRAAPPSVFTTLTGGLGALIDALAAKLPTSWLRLSTPVTVLQRTTSGWSIETGTHHEEYDRVLLALPLDATRNLLASLHMPDAEDAASLLPADAASCLIVGLAYGAEAKLEIPSGFGFLVPPDGNSAEGLLAATFVDQKFAQRAPAGATILRAFFARTAADHLAALPDAEIVSIARSQLSTYLGQLPAHAQITLVRRMPRSLPQYEVGHLARVAQFESLLQSLPGLAVTGNMLRGVGLPDMVREAARAAHGLMKR